MYWMQIYLKSDTTLRALICGLIDADSSHSEIGVLTFMVRSPEAETMYLSSKSTTLTAALCPTRTRRRLMSVGEAMSHTAMERSFEQVTINPLQNRRWSTASLWWIRVFRTSPEFTSQTLGKKRRHEKSAQILSVPYSFQLNRHVEWYGGDGEMNRGLIESERMIEIWPDSRIRGAGNNDSLIILQTQHRARVPCQDLQTLQSLFIPYLNTNTHDVFSHLKTPWISQSQI